MTHKTNKSYTISRFLRNYSILSPDWSKAPVNFPFCKTSSLNHEEKISYETAKISWISEHPFKMLEYCLTLVTATTLTGSLVSFIFVTVLYYVNANYNLGLNFLTDLFA